jgi:AraC-like DNA-binding protein
MRTLYIRADACPPDFPTVPRIIQVSPLLRELILRASAMPVEYDENGRDGRIIDLLFQEIEWSKTPVVKMNLLRDARLLRIQEEFTAHPGNSRTLEELAAEAEVSCRTLARLFRSETSASFRTWRHQMRALAALPRLALGDAIIDIALDLGYETPGAFAAMFPRMMGTPPRRYFLDTQKRRLTGTKSYALTAAEG